ncbi:unnamed protein product [Euphydryas editha]|uniref:Peptidase M14 domain-containing protein n=1 Tax=Euphydryas editha TaxID=104508 RepID=A0AAU9TS12_EUPED|nr:unnamed protein product [Euphydryas editha]
MRWLICTLLLSYAFAKHEEYDGHALFSVKVQKAEHVDYFNTLDYPFDIWQYATLTRNGMVLVPKDYVQLFQNDLNSKGIEFVIETENIKNELELEDQLFAEKARSKSVRSVDRPTITWDRIYNLTEVNDYLQKVAEAYPDVVTLVNAGKSVEGRDINYLKISTSNFQDTSKPIIFIETLLHAREWVTLPASLHAIDKLVVNVTEQDLIDNYDWIILPVANPDGYEFTHAADGNRFWRKNRRTGVFPGDVCLGVDLNRNFDIDFGQHSSNLACSETYHGPSAFSEPETRAIRNILNEHDGRIELFIDIHSFGNLILYGWGTGQLPSNVFAIHAGGLRMAEAIDAVKMDYNNNYRVGNAALVLYPASGSAMDYGLAANVPLSYVYELPAYRGAGQTIFGFLVHPDFIEQAGMETWEGIKAGARFVTNVRSRY